MSAQNNSNTNNKNTAQKSSKMMGAKGKRKGPSKKTQVARAELSELSRDLKELQKIKVAHAETELEAIELLSMGVNDLLRAHYHAKTGAKEFKTFKAWKEEGYSVKKGESSYRVWGSPIRPTKEDSVKTPEGENAEIESSYKMFPMCSLFNELQVEKTEGEQAADIALETPLSMEGYKQRELVAVQEDVKPQDPTPPEGPKPENKKQCSVKNDKQADKFRTLADGMQSKIDACFSDRLTNTAKRLAQAEHQKMEGRKLERTQKGLRALAELHELGQVPQALLAVKSKKALYDLMAAELEPISNGWHTYYAETGKPAKDTPEALAAWALLEEKTQEQKDAEELERLVNGLQFSNIDGYFPTPRNVIEQMVAEAGSLDGLHVLEPSGGSAAILDYVTSQYSDVITETFETNFTLADILSRKGYNVKQQDFLTEEPQQRADVVLMNPPFEKLQDAEHVQHAFKFLKPGGKLVAIMAPGAFFRNDKKAQAFRTWFTVVEGVAVDLPEGSFKESGTGVATKMIVITAPELVGGDDDESNPFVCSNFKEKQEARQERYEDRASAASAAASQRWERGREMASVIPFGQPILVGHHSEKRDRNYRAKIDNQFRKSVELQSKADHYEGKAATVGTGGIASDDPKAIQKLKTELVELEAAQSLMKAANKAVRTDNREAVSNLGLSEKEIDALFEPDFAGRTGFPSYALSNNTANIRRIKKRIEALEELRDQAPLEFECEHFKLYVDDGRVHFEFDGKPAEEVRTVLKGHNFKWSRYSTTWVRKVTGNALWDAEYVKTKLLEILG